MPVYVYAPVDAGSACDHCRDGFEIMMGMHEDTLTECPECHAAIKKRFAPFGIVSQYGEKLTDKRIGDLGFTKLVKDDDGKFKKSAGKDIPGIQSIG